MVKYKGKVKKSNRGPHKNVDGRKEKRRSKSIDDEKAKRPKSMTKSISSNEASHTDADDNQDSLSDFSEDGEDANDSSYTDEVSKTKLTIKRSTNSNITTNSKSKRAKNVIPYSDEEEVVNDNSNNNNDDDDSDAESEDVPLSSLATNKIAIPTATQLKKNIIDLLNTVNLEETSLKVVREKVRI